MSPHEMLVLVAGLTAAAYAVELIGRRRWRRALRRLAAEWKMNFGRTDTLRLTDKVARHFPVPGAARLRVTNVIYGADKADADRYRYVFTAEFTAGVVRTKRRFVRVGTFAEPKPLATTLPNAWPNPLVLTMICKCLPQIPSLNHTNSNQSFYVCMVFEISFGLFSRNLVFCVLVWTIVVMLELL